MSQSAQAIFDRAPLGAHISYSDGQPRPPERFKRKLRDWKNSNGTGYLTERGPEYTDGPGTFALQTDVHASHETVVMIVSKIFYTDSSKTFAIISEPLPGQIKCITSFRGRDTLARMVSTQAEADEWLERNRSSNPRLEVVPDRAPIAA